MMLIFLVHVAGSVIAYLLVAGFGLWLLSINGKRRMKALTEMLKFKHGIVHPWAEDTLDPDTAGVLFDYYSPDIFSNRAADFLGTILKPVQFVVDWGLFIGFVFWIGTAFWRSNFREPEIAWLFVVGSALVMLVFQALVQLSKLLFNRFPGEPREMRKLLVKYDGVAD